MECSPNDLQPGRHAVTLAAMALVAVSAVVCAGCGGSTPSTPDSGTGSQTGNQLNVFTITSSGVSPKTMTVAPGSQVTFVNNDSGAHLMYSDPHPEHSDCTELNQVGALDPGQTRQSGNLNITRTCGFHDHNQPLNTGLHGNIVIR
jgi:plastocyanin